MKEKPLISIALATYNGEKYLQEFLNSIISQTYDNIEVIACDDQSTDKTVEILREYSKEMKLNYFVNQKRLGVNKNFEKAINLCTGDFIALADQDDIWVKDKLEILYEEIIKDDNILCVLSDAFIINENGELISNSFIKYIGVNSNTDFKSFLFGSRFLGCTFMIRRNLVNYALPFPNDICCHDWWLNIIASKKGTVKFVDKPLIYYRIHGANTTGALKASFLNLLNFYLQKGGKFMDDHQKILLATLDRLKPDLTPEENEVIRDLVKFNQRKDKYISLYAFYVFIKYFRWFASGKSKFLKLMSMFSSVIGYKTIKKINSLLK